MAARAAGLDVGGRPAENAPVEKRKPPRRPTSADVARAAGVSRTQVSYVLNDTGGEHVSRERRARIMEAARSLGYLPHSSAQALRRGYRNEFAIFFPAPYTPRINEMLGAVHQRGLADGCAPTQYSFNSYAHPERKLEAFKLLLASRPRGLFCSLLDLGMEEIAMAKDGGVELILALDVERHEGLTTLLNPAFGIGYAAGEHLVGLGHRRIGLIRPSDPIQARPFELRLRGFAKAAEESGGAELVVMPWPSENLRPTLRYAEEFVRDRLGAPDAPTALYAYSDDYALPLLAALTDRGVRVPEDLSLLGTDDLPYGAMARPALSTVELDARSLGERAVELMNRLLVEGPAVSEPDPRPRVIARASTAAP